MERRSNSGKREVRALLWLLPVLAVVSWLVWEIARVKITDSQSDTTLYNSQGNVDTLPSVSTDGNENSAPQLFVFDPNTVEYHDLICLGFERGEALGIIKYRERGKIFEIPEDFAACYQVSEAMYRRLKPYIRIGEKYRLKPFVHAQGNRNGPGAVRDDENGAVGDERPSTSDSTFVENEAVTQSYESRGWVASGRLTAPLVDLNTADSATLISVVGIGPRTVVSIMEFRARLGGFARVEQLAEVRGMTEQNYDKILEQVFVDPAVIQKISINFAPAKSLAEHPYIRAEALRKLLKERQLKGGWRSQEELSQDNIFNEEELSKLGPYLVFD